MSTDEQPSKQYWQLWYFIKNAKKVLIINMIDDPIPLVYSIYLACVHMAHILKRLENIKSV